MTEPAPQPEGAVVWADLTVPDAEATRDFYADVVGWQVKSHAMGDYDDYELLAADGRSVAGVCHARGSNADMPPQWLLYVVVDDAAAAADRCRAAGGEVVTGPRAMGGQQIVVVKDPAGAMLALVSD